VRNSFRNTFAIIWSAVVLLLCLASPLKLAAQTNPPSKPDVRNRLTHLPALEQRFGPNFTSRLSSGGASMFHIGKVLSNPAVLHGHETPQGKLAMQRALARIASSSHTQPQAEAESDNDSDDHSPRPVPVNDAGLDFQFSRFAGFTQSETSSAWCGNSIVAGFNDSGALLRSALDNVGGSSFTGVAASQNRGRSFTGLPFLNPGSNPATFLGGDPVVVCSDSQHFFYSSLLSQVSFDSQGNLLQALTGVTVSRSSTGGLVWDDPQPVVTKDATMHFVDKEWLAVDPNNSQNLYVTYTDFGAFGSDPTCNDHVTPGMGNGGPDVRIEMVASKDGGNSWGAPVLVDHQCALNLEQNLSGSQVAVGPKGQVYVAYAFIDQTNAEIRFSTSLDGGATFGPVVAAAEAATASTLGFDHLEGNFRTNAFPTLAVDNSATPTRGTIYLAWTDASRNQIPDIVSNFTFINSIYAFGDIVLSSSSDGGNTWSTPKLVSPTPANFRGSGRDQFMSGVAVDARGNLAVCYSDRRNDPNNLAVDHFCSLSRDHGSSFRDVRQTPFTWSPGHTNDVFINPAYMGDYDAVSSDVTGANAGFFSTFQIQTNTNPDVFGTRLKP
jgi:hypothetical protein